MRKLKNTGIGIIIFLVVQHVLLWSTGNLHFYNMLADTVFKGRLGPSILDHENYPNRTIETGIYQPWALADKYNKINIPNGLRENIESIKPAAFVVVHKNELLYEEYWDSFSDSSLSNSWSMAKSYISMLIGVAIKEGHIKSIDDKVGEYLSGYNEELDKNLTIKHLLTMTSGIDFGEQYMNPFGFMAKALYGDDVKDIAQEHHVEYSPGTKWHYQGGNNLLLGILLREATGKTPAEYFSEKIWKLFGAQYDALWSLDKEDGYEKAYCCVFSNAKDFARVGQLMLQKGNWNGQQILDSNYVVNGAKPINLPDRFGENTDHYGYAWWLMNYKGNDIFYARGISGQYTIIIPEKELVIVRLGHKRIKEKGDKHPKDVYFYIDAALNMEARINPAGC
ncbi:MAG: serine hydrolase [Flavobacteriales bacterium]|nr:serine hydrolase [Flavobacteriales bacterium]